MAVGDGVGAQGAGMGIGLGPPGQSPLGTSDSGGDYGGGGYGGFVMTDLEHIATSMGYNDSKAIVEAYNRNTIDQDQFTQEFNNLNFFDRFLSALGLYSSSLTQNAGMTTMSTTLNMMGMPMTSALSLAALGAATTGNVFGQSTDPDSGPGGMTEEDFQEYINRGLEYSEANGIDPNALAVKAIDQSAAETLVNQLAPELGGEGRHYDESVAHVLGVLENGGRESFDMSQGGGIPEWWADYVRTDRPSLLAENYEPALLGQTSESRQSTSSQGGSMATNSSDLVRGLYKDLFNRDNPNDSEIQYWVDQLESGAVTQDGLEAAMSKASEDWTPASGGTQWVNSDGKRVWDSAQDPAGGGNLDSGLGADDAQTDNERLIRSFYEDLFGRGTPDAEGVAYWTERLEAGDSPEAVKAAMMEASEDWTDQGDGNWLRGDSLQAQDDVPTDYQYDPNNAQAFTDYVNSFYDQALSEYQNQSDQMQTATDEYKDSMSDTLDKQEGMAQELESRLDSGVADYEQSQDSNIQELRTALNSLLGDTREEQEGFLNQLDTTQSDLLNTARTEQGDYLNRLDTTQTDLFDTAKSEQDEYLSRLTGAIDDTSSDNLPRVTRLAGGQTVEYIPKSLRAANNDDRTAELELYDRSAGQSNTFLNTGTQQAQGLYDRQADSSNNLLNVGTNQAQTLYAGQSGMSNNLLNAGYDSANSIYNAGAGTADSILNASSQNARNIWDAGSQNVANELNTASQGYVADMGMADQGNATLNYLEDLKDLVDIELERIYSDQGLEFRAEQNEADREQAEPGMLDLVLGIGTLASGTGDLFEGLGGFFD
jgi:hypothetical protein